MQFSPLQSRLMASVLASFLILILYLLLFPPSFALAAEIPFDGPSHYDVVRDMMSPDTSPNMGMADPAAVPSELYEPIFSPFERSIMGRQDTRNFVLADNSPQNFDLPPGETRAFLFEAPTVGVTPPENINDPTSGDGDLPRRQTGTPTSVCISANMCSRPDNTDPVSRTTVPAPQLTLYLSTSADNTSPGPDITDPSRQEHHIFTQGAFMLNMTTDANLYFSISAPDLIDNFEGSYNFQIAASTEACYYAFDDTFDGNITWVQSDASGALLVANDVPIGENSEVMPFLLFAQSRENDWKVNGVLFSYCGLQNYAEVMASADGSSNSATTRLAKRQESTGTGVKQQFYFNGLEDNSFYWGILALDSRQTGAGQGGTVFSATNFTTASAGGTCELMFDLEFCTDVAYPVPGNKDKFPSAASLRNFYDNYTQTTFAHFITALSQIPCEAPASQAYSLVRNCDDCKEAYKAWLCSVAIPSCREVTAGGDFLLPRNLQRGFTNGSAVPEEVLEAARLNGTDQLESRNIHLDTMIAPGPYKELLPCDNQCYRLVQSCPSALGFNCPLPGMVGFNTSYREQTRGSEECNNPFPLSGAGVRGGGSGPTSLGSLAAGLGVVVILLGFLV